MMTQADKLIARVTQARGAIITVSVVVDSAGVIVGFIVDRSTKLEGIAKSDYSSGPVDVMPQLLKDGGGLIEFNK